MEVPNLTIQTRMKKTVLFILLFSGLFSSAQKTVAQLMLDTRQADTLSTERADWLTLTTSNGENQEYYYVWPFFAALKEFQVTGDETLLAYMMQCVNNMRSNAVQLPLVNGVQYEGWPADSFNTTNPTGSSLWDQYMTKDVTELFATIYNSPILLSKHRAWVKDQAEWFSFNFWDKYSSIAYYGNMFGYAPYDTSLVATIGLNLRECTKEDKFTELINRLDYIGGVPLSETVRGDSIASLTTQLRDTVLSSTNIAYQMRNHWYNPSASDRNPIIGVLPDIQHNSSVMYYMLKSYEYQNYWQLSDLQKWAVTINELVWSDNSPLSAFYNINGTGEKNISSAIVTYGTSLGAFIPSFQARLETYMTPSSSSYMKWFQMAQVLYNRKILDEGRPMYPENYPLAGGLIPSKKKIFFKKKSTL